MRREMTIDKGIAFALENALECRAMITQMLTSEDCGLDEVSKWSEQATAYEQIAKWLEELQAYYGARGDVETCEFCYYRGFDSKAYPCSRCICNRPTENKFRAR